MLRGEGVTKRFGGLLALQGLDFELRKGEIVGLIGPNGSGKTTLFDVVSGFHLPDRGAVFLSGKRIDGLKPYRIAKLGIGRTFQIVRPLAHLTALENVAIGVLYGRMGGRNMQKARVRALEVLDFTGLRARSGEIAANLSLAERKRLEVARALATQPDVLLLDEVFAGLNQVEIEEGIDLVGRIQKSYGITIFMIEHVMKAIMRTCHRIIAIHHGEKIAEGSPEKVANHPDVIEAYLGSTDAEGI